MTDPSRRRIFARNLCLLLAATNLPYTAFAAYMLSDGAGGPAILIAFIPLLVTGPSALRAFLASQRPTTADHSQLTGVGLWSVAVGGTLLLLFCGHVLFIASCFPVGLATMNINGASGAAEVLPWVVGTLVASLGSFIVTGWVLRWFVR
ncbi:MAG: hypothetical protein U0746_15710 [Gemmataceae bacterium]